MSEWICTKCGETALSKCPHQRNVFPTHQLATCISSDLCLDLLHGKHKSEFFLNISIWDGSPSIESALNRVRQLLSVDEEILKYALCSHDWVLNSETNTTCYMGCTNHRNLSSPPNPDKPKVTYTPVIELLRGFRSMTVDYIHVILHEIDRLPEDKKEAKQYRTDIERVLKDFCTSMDYIINPDMAPKKPLVKKKPRVKKSNKVVRKAIDIPKYEHEDIKCPTCGKEAVILRAGTSELIWCCRGHVNVSEEGLAEEVYSFFK